MATRPPAVDVETYLGYFRLLDVDAGADEAAIRKAWRRKALELHPDKNPDDPRAEARFDAAKKASDALLDGALRSEMAPRLAAREATAARHREGDAARRQLREGLEARERAAAAAAAGPARAAPPPRADAHTAMLARLRAENRDRARRMEEALHAGRRPAAAPPVADDGAPRGDAPAPDAGGVPTAALRLDAAVRVAWVAVGAGDGQLPLQPPPPPPDDDALRAAFGRFGAVEAIALRRPAGAVVVFRDAAAATLAAADPPSGFRVGLVRPGGGSGGGAGVGTPPADSGVGRKRPAPDGASVIEGEDADGPQARGVAPRAASVNGPGRPGPAGPPSAAAAATVPVPAVPAPSVSLADRESDVLTRMLAAAAARRAAAAAATAGV